MQSASFSIVVPADLGALAVDPAYSRGLTLDVEPQGLVLRGMDKAIVGQTKTPDDAAKVWNDETGQQRAYVLATGASDVLTEAQAQLITFYTSDGAYADRLGAVTSDLARGLLLYLLPMFGAKRMDRSGWYCGSHAARRAEKSAAQRKQLEKAAKILQNAETLKLLADVQKAQNGQNGAPTDLAALVASLVSSLG
jgi:hypothetical protein